jgi:hypothetical protein
VPEILCVVKPISNQELGWGVKPDESNRILQRRRQPLVQEGTHGQ